MGIVNFRKYARVEVDIPVEWQLPGADEPQKGFLNNISEEGASLICSNSLPVAASMEFDISLPRIEVPAHVRADILWSRPVYENGEEMYAHGLIFNRIDVGDRERIHSFISSAMSY